MKKLIILGSLLGALVSLNSCRDEFLESEPTETLANPDAQSKLNGLYLMMVNTGTGGTKNHDDFGQKGYDIYSDLLSSDMVLSAETYGWYSQFSRLNGTADYTNLVNYKPWRYYYRIAYAANDVIAGLGGNDATVTNVNDKYAMGQAKAMRAYAYFNLMQFYTPAYDASGDGVPLYTSTSVAAQPTAKQSEVYAQIIKDLNEAVALLEGYSRPNKGVVNKFVAEGLLAYAYAATGDYTNAAKASLDIVQKGGFPLTKKEQAYDPSFQKGGFNNINTESWMWGFDITEANDLDLVSWWGQADIFTYSYAAVGDYKSIDLNLWAEIPSYDVRKNQFVTVTENKDGSLKLSDADQPGDYEAVPANKFYTPQREIQGQRNIVTDYVFMRVDEFYLLAAESLAKTGQEAQAKIVLKKLLAERYSDSSKLALIDTLSGAALLKEINFQTRIELWGEGKSYYALKRNRGTINRGPNHLYFVGQQIPYNDKRLYLKIPQAEINNNPHISN